MSRIKLIKFLCNSYHLHSNEFLYVDKDYNWEIHSYKTDIPNFKYCGNLRWLKNTEYRTFVLRDYLNQFTFKPGYSLFPYLGDIIPVNIEGFIAAYAQFRLDEYMCDYLDKKIDFFIYPNRVSKIIHFVNNIYG